MREFSKTMVYAVILGIVLPLVIIAYVVVEDVADLIAVHHETVNELRVGATPVPHGEILRQVADQLKDEGIKLTVVEFDDYITPNKALDAGGIDANFFQHVPYLNDFNAEYSTNLEPVLSVHFEPLTIFAGKSDNLENIRSGATIAIPNDTTNRARALLLLETEGLIELEKDVGMTATVDDIKENPYGIEIIEAEAETLPRLLRESDFAVINGNFALMTGIGRSFALASEESSFQVADEYANVLVVRSDNKHKPEVQKLIEALQSDAIREFIESTYRGSVVTVF